MFPARPQEYARLARRATAKRYPTGIDGADAPRTIPFDLRAFGFSTGTLIADSVINRLFTTDLFGAPVLTLTLPAHGGLLIRPAWPSCLTLSARKVS